MCSGFDYPRVLEASSFRPETDWRRKQGAVNAGAVENYLPKFHTSFLYGPIPRRAILVNYHSNFAHRI